MFNKNKDRIEDLEFKVSHLTSQLEYDQKKVRDLYDQLEALKKHLGVTIHFRPSGFEVIK